MNNLIVYALLFGIMLQAGCSPLIQHDESTRPWSSAARQAMRQQIANPEAGTDAPVVGLDGRYASKVAEVYMEGPRTDPDAGQSVSETIIEVK